MRTSDERDAAAGRDRVAAPRRRKTLAQIVGYHRPASPKRSCASRAQLARMDVSGPLLQRDVAQEPGVAGTRAAPRVANASRVVRGPRHGARRTRGDRRARRGRRALAGPVAPVRARPRLGARGCGQERLGRIVDREERSADPFLLREIDRRGGRHPTPWSPETSRHAGGTASRCSTSESGRAAASSSR